MEGNSTTRSDHPHRRCKYSETNECINRMCGGASQEARAQYVLRRVPAVYLAWANPVFLALLAFNRINNLRIFSVAFSPIPTAPTTHPFSQQQLSDLSRRQKAAIRASRVAPMARRPYVHGGLLSCRATDSRSVGYAYEAWKPSANNDQRQIQPASRRIRQLFTKVEGPHPLSPGSGGSFCEPGACCPLLEHWP